MSDLPFYPYAVAPTALGFAIRADIEGLDVSGRTWPLFELDAWNTVLLHLEIELDKSCFASVLPEAEQAEPPCAVIVAVRSDSSRTRTSVVLVDAGTKDGTSTLTGQMVLRRRDVFGTVTLEPLLVRTRRASTPVDGLARELGDRLAWGAPYELQIDAPEQPTPGGTLTGRWEKFAESDDEWLKRHKGDLFALKLGSEPELLLNASVPGLRHIIDHSARRGKRARVQKATLDTLAVGVWHSLAGAAVGALQIAVADGAEEPLERLLDWQRGTLDRIAPRLYPTLNRADALVRLIDDLEGEPPEALAATHGRLFSAAQSLADSRKSFDGLLRVAEGFPA